MKNCKKMIIKGFLLMGRGITFETGNSWQLEVLRSKEIMKAVRSNLHQLFL